MIVTIGAPSWFNYVPLNRCCSLLLAGTYHKYDTIVYPPRPSKSFWEVWKSPDDIQPLCSSEMRQKCLHLYLKPSAIELCSKELLSNYSIVSFSKQVVDIHSQMNKMHTCKNNGDHRVVARPEVNKVMFLLSKSTSPNYSACETCLKI